MHDHQLGRFVEGLVAYLDARRNLLFADLDRLLRPLDRHRHVAHDRPARPAHGGDHDAGLPLMRLGDARLRAARIALLELGKNGRDAGKESQEVKQKDEGDMGRVSMKTKSSA